MLDGIDTVLEQRAPIVSQTLGMTTRVALGSPAPGAGEKDYNPAVAVVVLDGVLVLQIKGP